jgi:hypothetical protein
MTFSVLPTTHFAVLESFRKRALTRLNWVSDKTCFVSDFPIPEEVLKAAPGTIFATICAGSGVFDERAFAGGGYSTLHEMGRVSVTAIYLNRRDSKGKAAELLTNPADGFLTKFKRDILALGRNSDGSDWMPQDGDGNYLTTSVPMPINASMPQRSVGPGAKWAFIQIDFVAQWRWNLE